MFTRRSLIGAVLVSSMVLASCGGGAGSETSTTAPPSAGEESTTTTSSAPSSTSTTTTTMATTTTTIVEPESAAMHELFQSYFDMVVSKDYESARGLSTGPAADYASFTEDLNAISTQPDWVLEASSGVGCCDVISLENGHFTTAVALSYREPNGGALSVTNPVTEGAGGDLVLYEWGVDAGQGVTQPTLSQRMKNIAQGPEPDPTSCYPDGLWAYVPGGADLSTSVRVIAIARVCQAEGELIPKAAESRLYADDGSVDVRASTFLLEGGADMVPANTSMLYLAIFDIPRAAAESNLIWDTPFDRTNIPATTFLNFTIGPFDLD